MVQPSAMPMTPPESGIESLKFLIGYVYYPYLNIGAVLPSCQAYSGRSFLYPWIRFTLRKELLPKFLIRCGLTTETNNPASERVFIIGS